MLDVTNPKRKCLLCGTALHSFGWRLILGENSDTCPGHARFWYNHMSNGSMNGSWSPIYKSILPWWWEGKDEAGNVSSEKTYIKGLSVDWRSSRTAPLRLFDALEKSCHLRKSIQERTDEQFFTIIKLTIYACRICIFIITGKFVLMKTVNTQLNCIVETALEGWSPVTIIPGITATENGRSPLTAWSIDCATNVQNNV